MTQRIIPEAEQQGARFIPNVRVTRLIKGRRRIEGVMATVRADDGTEHLVRMDARHVFVCAGATETPALLLRSGIKYHVGNTLRVHPYLKVVARYREQGWKSAIGWIWFALGIAIPVVAFELYKLAALGVGGYQRHLESVRGFADAQNIPLTQMPSVLSSHLSSAAGLISVSIILVVVLLVIAWLRAKRATLPSGFGSSPTHQPDALHIVIALTVGIVLMFGWWLLRSQQASPRPAVPAVLWIAVAASGITMMLLRLIA